MVTILDCVIARLNIKKGDGITGEDCDKAGFAMLGGCEHCGATIAAYNAYPSKGGYWNCRDCIGDDGYETTEEALKDIFADAGEDTERSYEDIEEDRINDYDF